MPGTVTGADALSRRLAAVGAANVGRDMLGRLGLRTVREAKLRVARKTGNTGRSIHIKSASSTAVVVVAGGAGLYLERGTRPHVIRPVRKKVLRWGATPADRRLSGRVRRHGNVVFAKVVHHPGTRPQPFMKPGLEAALRQTHLADDVIAAWNAGA